MVAATCVGAGDTRLEGKTFRLCCLDEASQAVEPAALVPLLKGCEAAVMVGDACQLPPTVISRQVTLVCFGSCGCKPLQKGCDAATPDMRPSVLHDSVVSIICQSG